MRQNRDCRGIFAAAAAVKSYSTELGNQVLSFAGKSRQSRQLGENLCCTPLAFTVVSFSSSLINPTPPPFPTLLPPELLLRQEHSVADKIRFWNTCIQPLFNSLIHLNLTLTYVIEFDEILIK